MCMLAILIHFKSHNILQRNLLLNKAKYNMYQNMPRRGIKLFCYIPVYSF